MNQAPSIDVRKTAFIINLTSIRALVKYDKVLISAHDEDQETHQLESYLIHDLQGKIRNKEISEYFELRVLVSIQTIANHQPGGNLQIISQTPKDHPSKSPASD